MQKENICNVDLELEDLRELFDVDADEGDRFGLSIRVPEETDFVRLTTHLTPEEVPRD